jgi:hypothetical protein
VVYRKMKNLIEWPEILMNLAIPILFVIFTDAAHARVDWKVERAYEGGGWELEFGLLCVALFVLGHHFFKYFGYTICKECSAKIRGDFRNKRFCPECGKKLPKSY